MQFFERGKFTARARIIGYNLLRHGVSAKELGGCMEALAPLFGVKLVSDNPAHSAVPSDKTSRKFQVSSMACSCTASQLHCLTAAPPYSCTTPAALPHPSNARWLTAAHKEWVSVT